ncbi:hypothetical protein C8R47DRAFT_1218003 [Mycena vitilis]|nr:hypothetical protein C8R47DRAFT_1218003 [Mycena vitilis]
MSGIWSGQNFPRCAAPGSDPMVFRYLQLKANARAVVTPKKTVKVTNATLGSDISKEPQRTLVLFAWDSPSSSDEFKYIPVFSLTTAKDEHKCLDLILVEGHEYTFLTQGPDDIHILGYLLDGTSPVHTTSTTALVAPPASITTNTSASTASPGYMVKELSIGQGAKATYKSTVIVDLVATHKGSANSAEELFVENNSELTLDGASEPRGWKSSIVGMKLATGEIERSIKTDFMVDVILRRVKGSAAP